MSAKPYDDAEIERLLKVEEAATGNWRIGKHISKPYLTSDDRWVADFNNERPSNMAFAVEARAHFRPVLLALKQSQAEVDLANGAAAFFRQKAADAQILRDHAESRAKALEADLKTATDALRDVSAGTKILVRFGSYGCLTDDCDHWDDGSCNSKQPLCRIGRVMAVQPSLSTKAQEPTI